MKSGTLRYGSAAGSIVALTLVAPAGEGFATARPAS